MYKNPSKFFFGIDIPKKKEFSIETEGIATQIFRSVDKETIEKRKKSLLEIKKVLGEDESPCKGKPLICFKYLPECKEMDPIEVCKRCNQTRGFEE